MAVLTATPTTFTSVEAQATAGDTIILQPGRYTTRPNKAGVTYQAADWVEGMAITGTRGHLGEGMGVVFTTTFHLTSPNMTLRGVYHDTRGFGTINAGVITASGITFEDCSASARPNSGARQIGYTLGSGSQRVSGIRFLRCRHHPTGQAGQALDHAMYLKNCTGCTWTDCVIYDGGRFPFHLYTDADNNRMERCVVWGSGGCITFSGASDASTGTSVYGTSDNNLMTGCILGNAARGSLVESWTSDPRRPVTGNVVRDTMMWPRSGGTIWDGKQGVVLINNVVREPGFKDPQRGDFTRTGTYDGYGPSYLFGVPTPPPPPPPPADPDPDPDPDPEPEPEPPATVTLPAAVIHELRRDLTAVRNRLTTVSKYTGLTDTQRAAVMGAVVRTDRALNRIPE